MSREKSIPKDYTTRNAGGEQKESKVLKMNVNKHILKLIDKYPFKVNANVKIVVDVFKGILTIVGTEEDTLKHVQKLVGREIENVEIRSVLVENYQVPFYTLNHIQNFIHDTLLRQKIRCYWWFDQNRMSMVAWDKKTNVRFAKMFRNLFRYKEFKRSCEDTTDNLWKLYEADIWRTVVYNLKENFGDIFHIADYKDDHGNRWLGMIAPKGYFKKISLELENYFKGFKKHEMPADRKGITYKERFLERDTQDMQELSASVGQIERKVMKQNPVTGNTPQDRRKMVQLSRKDTDEIYIHKRHDKQMKLTHLTSELWEIKQQSKRINAAPADPYSGMEVVLGELAKQKVDVIINTSNDNLKLDIGAVSNSLLKNAGQEMQHEVSKNYPQGITPGEIAESKGYRLGVSRVLHCSLRSWNQHSVDIQNMCRRGLVQVVQKSLERTAHLHKTSIAFPALGTGVLKYPFEVVAHDMINTVQQHYRDNPDTSIERVLFVIYSKDLDLHQVFKLTLDEKTGKAENTVLDVSDYGGVVIADSKGRGAEAKAHFSRELLSGKESDVDISGRRQENKIEANFSKRDDSKHNARKPNGNDLTREGHETITSYTNMNTAIVGTKSEGSEDKERQRVNSANTLLALDEMQERDNQDCMWKNDSYIQTVEGALQAREELKRPGHQHFKGKIVPPPPHMVAKGQYELMAGYSDGLTPDKGARPKIPTIDISGRQRADSSKKGFLQRDKQTVSKRGHPNLKTRRPMGDDIVTDGLQQTLNLVSVDVSTGDIKSGEREGKEVGLLGSDEITSREDEEVGLLGSDEITSREDEEVGLLGSDEITSREDEEVGLLGSDEITSREDEEVGIRDPDEVQRSLCDSSDGDSAENGAIPKNPTTYMGFLAML